MSDYFEQVTEILRSRGLLTRQEIQEMGDEILAIFGYNRPSLGTAELCKAHHPNSKVAAIKEYRVRVPQASLRDAVDAINEVW